MLLVYLRNASEIQNILEFLFLLFYNNSRKQKCQKRFSLTCVNVRVRLKFTPALFFSNCIFITLQWDRRLMANPSWLVARNPGFCRLGGLFLPGGGAGGWGCCDVFFFLFGRCVLTVMDLQDFIFQLCLIRVARPGLVVATSDLRTLW